MKNLTLTIFIKLWKNPMIQKYNFTNKFFKENLN